jgi:general secretion pathway protein K
VKKESGFALVITLIVTALLVAVAVEFIREVYVENSLSRSYADARQAALMADSGVYGGMKLLQTVLSGQSYSSLLDRWALPIELDDEKGSLRVDITDESGKLNMNSIVFPNGTLNEAFFNIGLRLIRNRKLPADLLDAAADWIDENDEPRPGGAESKYYKSLPVPYQAKNAALDTFDELRMVKGFDEKTLNTLHPFITVYGDGSGIQSSLININTAPPEVLAALDDDMTGTLVDRILEYRKTTPFKAASDIVKIPGLEGIGQKLYGLTIGVKGTVYLITSQATVNGTIRIVEALVRTDGLTPVILYWREM